MNTRNWMRRMAVAAGVALVAGQAGAQAVISNGTISLGVAEQGHLNFGGVGVRYDANGFDGTISGCRCEAWGAGVNGGTFGYASFDNGGVFNVTPVSFTSTASTATSVVDIGGVLRVTHAYAPSASPNLYRVDVTLENLTNGVLGDVTPGSLPIRYQRLMDWDIQPTEFSEFVTIQGSVGGTNVIGTNNNGFDVADLSLDPITNGCTPLSGDFTYQGPCDHGANFLFGFDALNPLSSRTLTIFYGAGANSAQALAALATVGAEIYSLGSCDPQHNALCTASGEPTTFAFGFKGVGGTANLAPEPSSYMLMATGLAGIFGVAKRRRRK